jgi:hypothetical protein
MADLRLQLAVFEPPPGNLGEFDVRVIVYEDGGVEVLRRGQEPIVIAYPRCEPTSVEAIQSHDFRYRPHEFCSWYEAYAGYPTHFEGPRRCPDHLPVNGVTGER